MCALACSSPNAPGYPSAADDPADDPPAFTGIDDDDAAAPGDDDDGDQDDGGAIDPVDPTDGAAEDAPPPATDGAAVDADAVDGAARFACPDPPGPGDLAIDELMIESVAGSGDHGEWLEVRSTRACVLDLKGLHAECPSGTKVHTLDVLDDLWLPPYGTFVIADSADPAIDHDLPPSVLVWAGDVGDVLRNLGATITLRSGDAIVDSITYPALKLTVGVSIAFPSGCSPAERADWTKWSNATTSWFPAFYGSPNARNGGACP